LKKKKIILLGYNGSIGNVIFKKLLKKNIQIFCVGRNKKKSFFSNVKYVNWDFLDFSQSKLHFLNNADIIINCTGEINNNKLNLKQINLFFVRKLLNYIIKLKKPIRLFQLSSVSVYGASKKYLFKKKTINENCKESPNDLYSDTKLDADNFIKRRSKLAKNKFSYTIFRITNVIGHKKISNIFKSIIFLLKRGIWIKYSYNTKYHFIHVNDVANAIIISLMNLEISKNQTYIVSDDSNQYELHKAYANFYKKKLIILTLPIILIKFFILFFPLPKKILNFFLVFSSQISYENKKLKKSLGYNPKYSLQNEL